MEATERARLRENHLMMRVLGGIERIARRISTVETAIAAGFGTE